MRDANHLDYTKAIELSKDDYSLYSSRIGLSSSRKEKQAVLDLSIGKSKIVGVIKAFDSFCNDQDSATNTNTRGDTTISDIIG